MLKGPALRGEPPRSRWRSVLARPWRRVLAAAHLEVGQNTTRTPEFVEAASALLALADASEPGTPRIADARKDGTRSQVACGELPVAYPLG